MVELLLGLKPTGAFLLNGWKYVLSIVVAAQGLLILGRGVRLSPDSYIYLDGAERLFEGAPLDPLQSAYIGYIAFLGFMERLDPGLTALLVAQVAIAGIAAFAAFDLGARLHSPFAGAVASLLFIFNPAISRWHHLVLTDSLYISAVVLAAWALFRAATDGRWWYLTAGLMLVGAGSIRPSGWFLIAAAPIFLILVRIDRVATKWILATLVGVAVATAILIVPMSSHRVDEADPLDKMSQGNVIPPYPQSWIEMPEVTDSETVMTYVTRHPVAVARLGLLRVGVEIAAIRPYYRTRHNVQLLAWFGLSYTTAALGWWSVRSATMSKLLVILVIAHMLFIAVSFASYDGRFIVYVMPLVGIFSGVGVARACEGVGSQTKLAPVLGMGDRPVAT